MINRLKYLLSDSNYGLIIAIIGVIIQGFHTYFAAQQVSSIQHPVFTPIYAVLLSIFISSGLLFFTLRAGKANTSTEKYEYEDIAKSFRWFETIINIYYTMRKLVYMPVFINGESWYSVNYIDVFIGITFGFGIPYILYKYSGQIKFHATDKKQYDIQIIRRYKDKSKYRLEFIDDEK